MSDMELIMQLAKLEEQEEDERLDNMGGKSLGIPRDGAEESSSEIIKTDEFELNDCVTNSDDSSIVIVNDDMSGETGNNSPVSVPLGVQPVESGVKNTDKAHMQINTEFQDLAALEKELGLDDLQLFLDSSTTTSASPAPSSPNFKSPEGKKSDRSGIFRNRTFTFHLLQNHCCFSKVDFDCY